MVPVYDILGLKPTATDEELKQAYRRLAREYHPDKCGGDDSKMTMLNEAYHLVDTPEKRKLYDESNAFAAEFDMLSTVFGRPEVAKNFGKKPPKKSATKHGSDIDLTVNLPLNMFIGGVQAMPITFKRKCECLECSGTGAKMQHACQQCGGYGFTNTRGHRKKCDKCDGLGYIIEEKCPECAGVGMKTRDITTVIPYKPWTRELVMPGDGNNGAHGGENGNLNIKFNVQPVDGFAYDPNDDCITGSVRLYPEDLILGATTGIKIGDRTFGISISPAEARRIPIVTTSGGRKFRLGVELIEPSPEDEKLFYAIRNNHVNDII